MVVIKEKHQPVVLIMPVKYLLIPFMEIWFLNFARPFLNRFLCSLTFKSRFSVFLPFYIIGDLVLCPILARAAGTNEQYLKKHFKLMFGDTVFRHILMFKMEKAKEMLLTGKYLVTEIAETVGYKHATHFTNAFKKFFGCLPQSFKSKVLWGGYFSSGLEIEAIEMFSALSCV